ncbi:glucose-1-phosphate thymidylyltransferase [bacterium]|nr:glucose-1-phosphate thymidylyltransferase [bacterium]
MNPYSPAELFELEGYAHEELFSGVENAWEALARLQKFLKERIRPGVRGRVEDGAHVGGDVEVAEDAHVEAGAYVRGPTILGPGTEVRHGAYVRGYVITGRGCVIGHASECKTAIFLDGAKAPHFAYVGDSILGNRVNLGAGTKLANLKVVAGGVDVVSPEGKTIATGLRKLGAILGDDVEIGCNAVTSPGTVIGRGTLVYPCASVRGTIARDSVVSWKPTLVVKPRRR